MKGIILWQTNQTKSTPCTDRMAGAISKPAKIYPTKSEAQAAGRDTAIKQGAEHIIHNLNGQIGSRNSYGKDPYPPKG